ncbi:hypothetical protein ACVXG7_13795 [Enterobacter hormaechei]
MLCITLTGAESRAAGVTAIIKGSATALSAGGLFARRDCRAANGRRRARKSERADADFR